MPKGKETPSNRRKRVTASARARISTRKVRKSVNTDNHGSFLQDQQPLMDMGKQSISAGHKPLGEEPSNRDIMAILTDMIESNKTMAGRIEKLESQGSKTSSPINARFHSHDQGQTSTSTSRQALQAAHQSGSNDQLLLTHAPRGTQHDITRSNLPTFNPDPTSIRSANSINNQGALNRDEHRDVIMPDLNVLRKMPYVADSVSEIMATYEAQARTLAAQGKPATSRRSGCYNAVDLISSEPERRWPNEGFHGGQGKKRLTYDELTLPQWVAGQLANIHSMRDHTVARQALLQVIHAMRDATSLPWVAVRNAYASSMHDVEEGLLTWDNTTQWALNRLSASQIAMTSQSNFNQATGGSQTSLKRPCRYFNDGSCSHDSHHGQYRHICSYCARAGRTNPHPEAKCNFKMRSQDKPATTAT